MWHSEARVCLIASRAEDVKLLRTGSTMQFSLPEKSSQAGKARRTNRLKTLQYSVLFSSSACAFCCLARRKMMIRHSY
jgi:hypothetical protein